MSIPVERVGIGSKDNDPLLLLDTARGVIRMKVGAGRAYAIAASIVEEPYNVPMIYDVVPKILTSCGASIVSVVVTDHIENTFYSELVVAIRGVRERFEMRPSDAIALAKRISVPIEVAESVVDEVAETDADIDWSDETDNRVPTISDSD